LNFWQCSSNGEKQLVERREIIIDGLVKKHPPVHALLKQLKLFLMTKLYACRILELIVVWIMNQWMQLLKSDFQLTSSEGSYSKI
jgi:hypothetical protein